MTCWRGLAKSLAAGVATSSGEADPVARGAAADNPVSCRAALFATDAASFQESEVLQAEVFGSSSIVVRCADAGEMNAVAAKLEGQSTATIHADESDYGVAGRLLPTLDTKAGRILFNGWPTGVEVGYAMGARRPVPGDVRLAYDVGRGAGDRAVPPAGCLSGRAEGIAAKCDQRRKSGPALASH